MPFVNGVVSVGTAATVIATPGSVPESDGLVVQNLGTATVYLGGSTVTANTASTDGLQLAANGVVTVPTTAAAGESLYGITSRRSAA